MNKNFLKTTTILCGLISAPLLLLADAYEEGQKELNINGNTVVVKNVSGETTSVNGARGNTLSIDNTGEEQSIRVTSNDGEEKTIVSKEVSGNTTYINTDLKPNEVAAVKVMKNRKPSRP